jgi:hypothetical protein
VSYFDDVFQLDALGWISTRKSKQVGVLWNIAIAGYVIPV